MKLSTVILGSISAIVSLTCMSVIADELPAAPYLSTVGAASIDAAPDIATINIEVSYLSKDAVDAKRKVDNRVGQYFDFLHKQGIERKDINAANLSTQPEYNYQNGSSEFKGFLAQRQVQVTLRQLGKLNEILDGALKLGLNEIRAITFGVASPDRYQEQVRQKAIQNATLLARSLAKGFEVKLGSIYSIHYQGDNEQSPLPVMFLRSENAASTPSRTYQQQIMHFKDQVAVVFELQKS